jgi:myo-inositol catabolism protein IolC
MTLGYDRSLYILAFDHRGSFQKKFFGVTGEPNAEETARIVDAKTVIFEGALRALGEGASRESAGILVDEQFGAAILEDARRRGIATACTVEKSGQAEFDFEFGDAFGAHIEDFDPTFAKVLVRYNPEGDLVLNARQRVRLRRLSDWLHERGRKLLFELLVPAEKAQLAEVGGDAVRYDVELRPRLVLQTMAELQDAGIEPDLWKIEGLDRSEDCRRVAEQARAGGREHVTCIVLGRGADEERVIHWLEQAAGVPGFVGFAVGRTLWWNELVAYVGGEIDRSAAAERIADNYHRMVEAWTRSRP